VDELRLDGNAAAGVLREVFSVEVTAAVGTCAGCGAADAIGAVHVYKTAGMVLRCAQCDTVLMSIVDGGSRVWISLRGLQSLEIRR
jgi:hypothetical protein